MSYPCPWRCESHALSAQHVLASILQERIAGLYLLSNFLLIGDPHTTAERAGKKDPAPYLLTVEQKIENGYPVPSYIANVFKKLDGWIETPQPTTGSVGGSNSLRD